MAESDRMRTGLGICRCLLPGLAGLTLLVAPLTPLAAARLALVVGIDAYAHLPDLANATHDARAVAARLQGLGFEVLLRENPGQREIYRTLSDFENRLASAGGTGLVFFAGHGIQADGRNYLIPADAQVEVEDDLRADAIDVGTVLEGLARAGNPLNIVVLDACRDNPLPRRTRSAARGLATASIPSGAKGTAIVYAAGEGQVAQDGPLGGHGVFTEALLAALDAPGLKLEEVIKQVTRGVLERTGGRQRPWSLASIQGDFVFNVPAPATARTEAAPTPSGLSTNEMARDVWLAIRESEDAELLEDFVRRFAETPYALAAEARLAQLRALTPVTVAKANTPAPVPAVARAAVEVAADVRKFGPHQMVHVRGTCFTIGTAPGTPGHQGDEKPREVCLRDFLIDRHEVTFDAYDAFARATGRDLPDDDGMGRGSRPVINVDWDDARAYAAWASAQFSARFRLPTEAEWEFACRGGGRTEPYCGGDRPDQVAVYGQPATQPVGGKQPNALGLYDMSGNAWEMTCSPYDFDFTPSDGSYMGGETRCVEKSPRAQLSLVYRGGSWDSPDSEIRAAYRRINGYTAFYNSFGLGNERALGFRLAAEP